MSWKNEHFNREFFLVHTGRVWECTLCKRSNFDRNEINHKATCVLSDPTVKGIRLVVTPERRNEICGNCWMPVVECPAEIGLGGSMVTHEIAYQICSIYKKAVDELCGG